MQIKMYRFRYRSNFEKLIGRILDVLSLLIVPPFLVTFLILFLSVNGLTEYWSSWMYIAFFIVSLIVGIVLAIRYAVNYKGVIVGDSYIEIDRYATSNFQLKMNIIISFDEIRSVYVNKRGMDYRDKFKKSLISGADLSSYVEIILFGGKQYCIPVENQEEFVQDVISRVNSYRKEHGLEEI